MQLLRRTLEWALLAFIVTGVTAPALSEAQEVYWWKHGLGWKAYFMPGGPQESWLTGCIVETELRRAPEHDSASLAIFDGVYNGMNTSCAVPSRANWIQIVTIKNGGLHNGRIAYPIDFMQPKKNGDYWYAWNVALGDTGDPIFGAHVSAINRNGFRWVWDIVI